MADQKGNINRPHLFGMEKIPSSLWDSLLQQLGKDFRHSFAETDSAAVYTELYALIKLAIENGSLPQLLYRIDVSEHKPVSAVRKKTPFNALFRLFLKEKLKRFFSEISIRVKSKKALMGNA